MNNRLLVAGIASIAMGTGCILFSLIRQLDGWSYYLYKTRRKEHSLRDSIFMLSTLWKSEKFRAIVLPFCIPLFLALHGILIAIIVTASTSHEKYFAIGFSLVLASVWLDKVFWVFKCPHILVLGASTPHTLEALGDLNRRFALIKISHLLDDAGYQTATERPKRIRFGVRHVLGDLRQRKNPEAWREVVDRLIDLTPLIVLDTRTITPFVQFELDNINRRLPEVNRILVTADSDSLVARVESRLLSLRVKGAITDVGDAVKVLLGDVPAEEVRSSRIAEFFGSIPLALSCWLLTPLGWIYVLCTYAKRFDLGAWPIVAMVAFLPPILVVLAQVCARNLATDDESRIRSHISGIVSLIMLNAVHLGAVELTEQFFEGSLEYRPLWLRLLGASAVGYLFGRWRQERVL